MKTRGERVPKPVHKFRHKGRVLQGLVSKRFRRRHVSLREIHYTDTQRIKLTRHLRSAWEIHFPRVSLSDCQVAWCYQRDFTAAFVVARFISLVPSSRFNTSQLCEHIN